MQSDIRRYCEKCDTCQRAVPKGKVPKASLVSMHEVDRPGEKVSVDPGGKIIPCDGRVPCVKEQVRPVDQKISRGHNVGNGKMTPLERVMEKIRQVEPPTSKKQVKSFLGLVGFYRRFIPHFAEIALPLTDLTKVPGRDRSSGLRGARQRSIS